MRECQSITSDDFTALPGAEHCPVLREGGTLSGRADLMSTTLCCRHAYAEFVRLCERNGGESCALTWKERAIDRQGRQHDINIAKFVPSATDLAKVIVTC